MKRLKYRNRFVICPLLALALSYSLAAGTPAKDSLIVFLVRHAEKVDSSRDPELSATGKKRAEELAGVLGDADIQHVHSSDFIRTRDTAAPIALRLNLKLEVYDPRDLPPLVEKLRQAGGRHLIVGHSSSIPGTVELLGGNPGADINEASEFDRLYIVTIDTNGQASTVLMRYGKSSPKLESSKN